MVRILRTLKARRDMSVNEARLIVSIEDPRTREQRQLGIEVRGPWVGDGGGGRWWVVGPAVRRDCGRAAEGSWCVEEGLCVCGDVPTRSCLGRKSQSSTP